MMNDVAFLSGDRKFKAIFLNVVKVINEPFCVDLISNDHKSTQE